MPTPLYLAEKLVYWMKESRCFSYKEKGHTAYNFHKKRKISANIEDISKNNNS